MYSRNRAGWIGSLGIVLNCSAAHASDMGTAFTYQGYLEKPAGTPLTDTCDFRFGLWDADAGENEVGTSPLTVNGVVVADGLALVAIQGFFQIVKAKDCEIKEVKAKASTVEQLEAKVVAPEALVAKLAAQQNGGGR